MAKGLDTFTTFICTKINSKSLLFLEITIVFINLMEFQIKLIYFVAISVVICDCFKFFMPGYIIQLFFSYYYCYYLP